MFITTEQTPNPNTLKFGVGKEVRGDATPLFFKKDTSGNPKAKAPVVEALFKIDDIMFENSPSSSIVSRFPVFVIMMKRKMLLKQIKNSCITYKKEGH